MKYTFDRLNLLTSRKILFSSYLLGMLLSCGFFALFFLGVNAAGDWQKYYVDSYVDRLIASPYGVTYPESISAVEAVRSIKLELARRLDVDCYVTGSSHHMLVSRSNLAHVRQHCSSLVNMASPAGQSEDFLTAVSIPFAKRTDKKITLYIGHTGFYNIEKRPPNGARSLRGGYHYIKDMQKAREILGLPQIFSYRDMIYRKIIYLSRWQYFLFNLGFPDYGLASSRNIGLQEDEIALLPDGSQRISQAVAQRQQPIEYQCSDYTDQQPIASVIEKSSVQAFEAILERLSRRGMKIIHLITPLHPDVFSCATPNRRLAREEIYLWSLAHRAGHTVLGSFDPRPFSINATDFYHDRAHLKLEAFNKIAAPLPGPVAYARAWHRLACPQLYSSARLPTPASAIDEHGLSCEALPLEEHL